jgi:hypothetical protein
MNTNEAAKVFETMLCAPGMNEVVKIDLKISRKNVLLLSNVIERGLSDKEDDKSSLLASIPKESMQELAGIAEDCLQKASLSEFNDKLKSLNGK